MTIILGIQISALSLQSQNEHLKDKTLLEKHSNLQSCKKVSNVNSNHEFYACKLAINVNILFTLNL